MMRKLWKLFFGFAVCVVLTTFLTCSAFALGVSDITIPQGCEEIIYGVSGEGRNLVAYKFGDGSNVMVLGYAIHGYEDNWPKDGQALVYTAGEVMKRLSQNNDLVLDYDWTIYVLPCMNPDGLINGNTNNGPGRCTTTYLDGNGRLVSGRGVDMNRSFPYRCTRYSSNRNFNGYAPLASRESKALADFIQSVKGKGTNICIDTHGWMTQIIPSDGYSRLYYIFKEKFPYNTYSNLNGGNGYFASYAASIGYKACLFEFPDGLNSMTQFQQSGYCGRYCDCIMTLVKEFGTYTERKATIRVNAAGNGTASGGGSFRVGALVTLKATPSGGKTFEGWYKPDGTQVSTSASYQFKAGEDLTLTALFSGEHFIDVPADIWYHDSAVEAADAGIVEGMGSPVIFYGNGTLTRAMAITLLARMAGADVKSAPRAPFTDVPASGWYTGAVNWGYANGIIKGVSETRFAPEETINREQFMTMLERMITEKGLKITPAGMPFVDREDTSAWAKEAVERFYARGLVKGNARGELLPKKELTRAEGVTFVLRSAEYLKKNGAD